MVFGNRLDVFLLQMGLSVSFITAKCLLQKSEFGQMPKEAGFFSHGIVAFNVG